MFSFASACAAHTLSNLCRDIFKLPSVLGSVAFRTTQAKFRYGHHIRRAYLIMGRKK